MAVDQPLHVAAGIRNAAIAGRGRHVAGYFGDRAMGTAYGGVFFISCIGMGIGSYAGGVIHDLLGSYVWLFLGSGAIGTMAIVLALTLRPPRPALRSA
jgi:MFS family permease